jgi:hypothetical protein
MADSQAAEWSGTHEELGQLLKEMGAPDDIHESLRASGMSAQAKSDCTRTWGKECVTDDGSVGRQVTLTCTWTDANGKKETQTREWCSPGSPQPGDITN